uniref:Uncharacterized protein n=1 Tax=Rhizophora mucronata TaxID=61149 RepID=A0A2P2PJY3_RHIMU
MFTFMESESSNIKCNYVTNNANETNSEIDIT